MAVYVDDMYDFKKYGTDIGKFGRMKMSHMLADTTEELLQMADKIGVSRKWIQNAGTNREHFDICLSNPKKAIQFGAKEITWRESGEIILRRKQDNQKEKDKETPCRIPREIDLETNS